MFNVRHIVAKLVIKMRNIRFLLYLLLAMTTCHAHALTIDSLRIAATLDEKKFSDGILQASFITDAASAVDYSLADDSGNIVASGSLPYVRHASERNVDINVQKVKKWSDETPYLYILNISAKDRNGKVIATKSHTIGFRVVAARYGKLYVNGLTPSLCGVNINSLLAGCDEKRMLDLISLLKRNNLNCVRTGYIDEQWLRLCDEYGIYLCSEVTSLSKVKTEDMRDNLYRMASHPSVILWSLSYSNGNNTSSLSTFLKSMRDIRPVMDASADATNSSSDIYFPQAISPKEADNFCNSAYPLHEKPLIINDLVRTGGNGFGDMDEWVEMLGKYPRFAGFFLPEGAIADIENGPTPGIVETTFLLNKMRILSQAPRVGRLALCNDNLYKTLSDVVVSWQVVNNGTVVSEGTCPAPDVKVNKVVGLSLKLADLAKAYPEGELALNVYCRLDKAQGLLPKGHELARSQFVIRDFTSQDSISQTLPAVKNKLKIKKNAGQTSVHNSLCKVVFDTQTGFMSQYNVGGVDLLNTLAQLKPNFWRNPTDNDLASGADNIYSAWRNPDMQLQSIDATKVDNPATGRKDVFVKAQYTLPANKVSFSITYTISENGVVIVKEKATMLSDNTESTIVPRFGMALAVPNTFHNVSYFGRGPLENYSDRKQSQFVGNYSTTVDNFGYRYSRPQENGLRTDLRWIRLTDDNGRGLEVKSRNLFSASALPEDTGSAVSLCLDMTQMGVGDHVNDGEYPETFRDTRVFIRNLEFSFMLCPLAQ